MPNVLEEFLIKLGPAIDETGFQKFQTVLNTSSTAIDKYAGGIVKSLLTAQIEIVGAFTAISTAVITMVDKVAMADQSYRLFALRMLMTQEAGRKLKIITDELGASMEELIWDPELHARAERMSELIDKFSVALGPKFEANMKGVRDIRAEVSNLAVAFKFLSMATASSIFEKLGGGDIGAKLKGFVDSLANSDKLAKWADKISSFLVPVLKETWSMFVHIGEAIKVFSDDFSELIGILSGDDSIDDTTDSFEKLGKAFGHVVQWASMFVQFMTAIETYVAHLIGAILHLVKAIKDLVTLNFSGVVDEVNKVRDSLVKAVKAPFDLGKKWADGEEDTTTDIGKTFDKLTGVKSSESTPTQSSGTSYPSFINSKSNYGDIQPVSDHSLEMRQYNEINKSVLSKLINSDSLNKLINSDSLNKLADLIQKHEGYGVPGALPTRNNNPGDIEFGKFASEHGGHSNGGRFAVFDSYDQGRSAEIALIQSYAKRGYTVEGMINKWAPSKENNTAAYLNSIAAGGINPNAKLSSLTMTTGDIIVNVPASKVDPQEIAKYVHKEFSKQTQYDLAQISPAYG